ncbi:MAG: hypothetical protein C5B51_13675 [Terriglobia bacterium]|nr:MAG: hypothetical protein C5B51_13675 [Terriglobia bacterium]
MFIIPAGGFHAIDAIGKEPLAVVTFHPETSVGWTDEYHPMLESTFVARKPANLELGAAAFQGGVATKSPGSRVV